MLNCSDPICVDGEKNDSLCSSADWKEYLPKNAVDKQLQESILADQPYLVPIKEIFTKYDNISSHKFKEIIYEII